MSDQLYAEARTTIQRRLLRPHFLTLHAMVFGFGASLGGWMGMTASNDGIINGLIYWSIFLWCLVLVGHGIFTYPHSGLLKSTRRRMIYETLIQLAYKHDLDTDELVDLHEQLDDEIQQNSTPFLYTIMTVGGYSALWHGMFFFGLFMLRDGLILPDATAVILQHIPVVGTFFLMCALIGALLLFKREPREQRVAYLQGIYTKKIEKRKHDATQRLSIDDEGEIVHPDESPLKTKTR